MKYLPSFAVVILGLTFSALGAVLPAEKLLPDDTLFLFSIPDFAKARDIYKNSPQAQLWQDPAMKGFRDRFLNKLDADYLTPLERDLGIHFSDFTNLPQGQVTFALVPRGGDLKDPANQSAAFVFLLDTKTNSSQLQTNLTDLRKKWIDAGKPIRTEKIHGLEFSVIAPSTNDLPKTLTKSANEAAAKAAILGDVDPAKAVKLEFYFGQAESLLILGDSPGVIERILAAMGGSAAKPLDELPAYSANHNAMFRDASFFAWFNAKPWVESLVRRDEGVKEVEADNNPFSFKWAKIVSATGLGGLKSIAFSYLYSSDGSQFNLAFSVPESSRTGLFKILAGEPKDCSPLPFVPADAVKFQRWRLDGQKTWAGIQKMLGDASAQWLNSLTFLLSVAENAAKEKDPDFSFKKNLFGNLGDDIITYSKLPKTGSGAEADASPSLVLVASPNADQLAPALLSAYALIGTAGGTPKEREFRGHKIFSLPPAPGFPGTPGATAAPPSPTLSYAAAGGYLAFSYDPAMLEEYLRSGESQGKSLRETSGLTDAMQKVVGSGTGLAGYSNDSEDMRVTFENLKKGPALAGPLTGLAPVSAALLVAGMPNEAKIKEWFDFSLLPPFDQISKYFSFSVHALNANQDGLSLKYFIPVPPQLKAK